MRVVLCIMFLILLILYIKNKRELFQSNSNNAEIVVGDVSYEDYTIDEMKINEFLYEKSISPVKMNYSMGKAGEGVTDEVTTLSLDVESVKGINVPETIKKIGDKEVVNLEAIVPFLVQVAQNNTKKISDMTIDFEKLRGEFVELKKKL